MAGTGWRRCIGYLKLQVSFRKRATNYRALLRKMTCEDKASYAFSSPCRSLHANWPPIIVLFSGKILQTIGHSFGTSYMYVYICKYIHIYIYVYTHTHIRMRIHSHTHEEHPERKSERGIDTHNHTHTYTYNTYSHVHTAYCMWRVISSISNLNR